MRNIRFLLPNLLTTFNLLLGCSAIIIVFRSGQGLNQYSASWVILIAAVCDVLDGWVARALDARSEFGKQMDSLADLVSFGVAPGMILFNWAIASIEDETAFSVLTTKTGEIMLLSLPLLYIVAAAFRLARFNVSQSGSRGFTGLPTPAAAIFICALWLIVESEEYNELLMNPVFIVILSVVLIFLMISRVKMLSLKLSGVGLKENIYPYILFIAGGILIIFFWLKGLILAMIFYLILSLFHILLERAKKRSG